ncbi:hypothetical protein [Deferrisoma sp.]
MARWALGLWLCVGAAPVWAGVPHLVYGTVSYGGGGSPAPGALEVYGYRPGLPTELLDHTSPGSGYDVLGGQGWLWVEAGNYPTPWSPGDGLRIVVVDPSLPGAASVDVTLDTRGAQQFAALTLAPGDHAGPVVYNVLADGASPGTFTEGTASFTLTATVSDAIAGGSPLQGAEYFVGPDPGEGLGTSMGPKDGAFDAVQEDVVATVASGTWAAGDHTVYVRGRDAAGNWGTVHAVVVTVTAGGGWAQGDIDHDGDVDRYDLRFIMLARNQPATGPDDERDLDGDGLITVYDARILMRLCSRPKCATE